MRASTARSIRMPREPLTSTRSPRATRAIMWAAAPSGVANVATSGQPPARAASAVTRDRRAHRGEPRDRERGDQGADLPVRRSR